MQKKFAIGLVATLLTAVLTCGSALASDLPGMPPPIDPTDLYAADRPGLITPEFAELPERIYVPNTTSNSVTVIDGATYKVLKTVKVGKQPQHVVPSWDMKTLWVNNDLGNTLTPINSITGVFGKPVAVHDPYNVYFTPDGTRAVVMASKDHQIVFRDAHTMKVIKSTPATCDGVNHADWSADGRTFVVSCEFSSELLLVDTVSMKILKSASLPHTPTRSPMPQDVKISPDGLTYYIADMAANGVWVMSADPAKFGKVALLRTGLGAHGLYVTRDSKNLLITNRDEGSISVMRFSDQKLIAKWHIKGGGSPDMGGLSADGKVFWISGRYSHSVYAISTETGATLAKIRVGGSPHGLAVFPQPGRYSLGHTGIFR